MLTVFEIGVEAVRVLAGDEIARPDAAHRPRSARRTAEEGPAVDAATVLEPAS